MDVVSLDEAVVRYFLRCSVNKRRNRPGSAFGAEKCKRRAELQKGDAMPAVGRFCCKSGLREASKRDSVLLMRIAARSIHDGPSEE
jgi:hypothetical protein